MNSSHIIVFSLLDSKWQKMSSITCKWSQKFELIVLISKYIWLMLNDLGRMFLLRTGILSNVRKQQIDTHNSCVFCPSVKTNIFLLKPRIPSVNVDSVINDFLVQKGRLKNNDGLYYQLSHS